MINRAFRRFSAVSRQRKLELFEKLCAPRPGETVLELGGEQGATRELLLPSGRAGRTVVLNIDPQHLRPRELEAAIHRVRADARRMPFSDRTFDLVFSNAVIEHVGTLADQRRMADEIRRVGKRWFVTTPNRWYPFEFHTRVPFYGWLPPRAMQRAARVVAYNHVRHRYVRGLRINYTRLLTRSELEELFPESLVLPVRVTFWPETLVVAGPREALDLRGVEPS